MSGDEFKFNDRGDGPARYNIIHYKQVRPGEYEWVNVGFFDDDKIEMNMDSTYQTLLLSTVILISPLLITVVQFQLGTPHPPDSICSAPCAVGLMKKYVEGESCCWTCHECGMYEHLDPTDDTRCIPCPLGTLPDEQHLDCLPLPEEYLRPSSHWAIGAIAFALCGIITNVGVLAVFLKYNDTPVVRASGRELSYVLLLGTLSCYLVTFLLVVRPTDAICALQEFSIGTCFSVVYGALLTKTNRWILT